MGFDVHAGCQETCCRVVGQEPIGPHLPSECQRLGFPQVEEIRLDPLSPFCLFDQLPTHQKTGASLGPIWDQAM